MTGMLWMLALVGCGDPCAQSGTMCSVAGTGEAGAKEDESKARLSPLYAPMDVTFRGDTPDFFIGDWNNHKIRLVEGSKVRTAIGTVFLGDGDPDFEERNAPGVPGTTVALNHPTSMEWNAVTERLLVPSWHNHRVREWDPETGNSMVVCANTAIDDGNGANAGFEGDGGPASDALMAFPNSIAIDPADGSFWLLAQRNVRIRKVEADFSLIDTMAGTGVSGYSGDGGAALDAQFDFWDTGDLQPQPSGAVEYFDGKLYIADTSNHTIRVIDLATETISTLPGLPVQTLPGGACDPEALCFPRDVEAAADGTLYIADEGNHVIRRIAPGSSDLEVVAGNFEAADSEDGVLATEGSLNGPHGIDVSADGVLIIADTYNHRVKKVTP